MEIKIRKPLGYSQIGRKDRQEDAVWPLFSDVTAENRCIVLCDGVGGNEHGEVASQVSSKVIGEYLTGVLSKADFVSEEDVQDAVNLAYDELERIDKEASEAGSVSMATTLTCICLHNNGILAAHMGDSRIYHIRPGEGLKYQSDDHSLVNALLKAGELTPEEAENFPRKNVITKAIQPHTERRFNAEVHQLTDVQSGDYLFLCCDGVLEQVTNDRLVEVLSMNCSDEEKLALLEADSMDKTRDNFTAYLIPIDSVEGESTIVYDDEIATVVVESDERDEEEARTAEKRHLITAVCTRKSVERSDKDYPYLGHDLEVGKEYEVQSIDVALSNTTVILRGRQGRYNIVYLSIFEDGKPIDVMSDRRFNPYIDFKERRITENNGRQEIVVKEKKNTSSKKILYLLVAVIVLSVFFFVNRCSSKGGNPTPKEQQPLSGVKQEVPKQKADSSAKEKQDPNKRKPVTTPLDKLEK